MAFQVPPVFLSSPSSRRTPAAGRGWLGIPEEKAPLTAGKIKKIEKERGRKSVPRAAGKPSCSPAARARCLWQWDNGRLPPATCQGPARHDRVSQLALQGQPSRQERAQHRERALERREVGKQQSAPAATRRKHSGQSGVSPRAVGTAACSPSEQEFELDSFPSCYRSSFPGLPALLPGLGRPLPQRSLCAQLQIQGEDKRGKWSGAVESTTPPGCLPGQLLALPAALHPPRSAIDDRWWHPAGAGAAQPLPPPSWVTNTSQRAEPIQELLVLLQVHFPAGPTTSSSAGRHRGTHKLRPLSAAQHSRWTPLSRPLTTGSVSLFDEAHESLPGLRPPPFFCK